MEPTKPTTYSGCSIPFCTSARSTTASTCDGTADCCQTTIPSGLGRITTTIQPLILEDNSSQCKYAFLVDQNWFRTNFTVYSNPLNLSSVPVVMTWGSTALQPIHFSKAKKILFGPGTTPAFFGFSIFCMITRLTPALADSGMKEIHIFLKDVMILTNAQTQNTTPVRVANDA
ncbi:hypothetical protein CJ030_MR0G028250 [Morella rubra]|uniref:Uncharacterized protein n=1 Tax=Morella rubra TaxID=262757 RepID=A0A6A1UFG9_9ROSI|nr:hypothetical protein CJ030_MR0G028250 [Morella rubra]